MEKKKIQVFYDGLCHLCSREIAHYRKIQGQENIEFVDITGAGFDAQREGLDPKAIHREMHVRKSDGALAVGVDGFIEIWNQLPSYHFLAQLAEKPLPYRFLSAGYKIFAKIRPYLPKRKSDCSESPHCDLK